MFLHGAHEVTGLADLLANVTIDSLRDTAQLVGFLFVTYLAMEALEHRAGHKTEAAIRHAGSAGPVVGGLLGALPQCGFSAMAATLYSAGVVTVGTLVAVILSTSDEMIPVFVAHGTSLGQMGVILGFKAVAGIVVGLIADLALRAARLGGDGRTHIAELCERAHCGCDDAHGHEEDGRDDTAMRGHATPHEGHSHAHGHAASLWGIARSALVHTVEVSFYIFVVTLLFGLVIEGVGHEALAAFLGDNPVAATFLAALIGLVPNCGASVALAELYLEGMLATGPLMAGLLVSGGMGLLVLFRTNPNIRKSLLVAAFVYATGVVLGLGVGALGISF